jgi:hypothetical protein
MPDSGPRPQRPHRLQRAGACARSRRTHRVRSDDGHAAAPTRRCFGNRARHVPKEALSMGNGDDPLARGGSCCLSTGAEQGAVRGADVEGTGDDRGCRRRFCSCTRTRRYGSTARRRRGLDAL